MGLMLAVGAVPRALGPFWAIESLQLVADSDGKYRTYVEFLTMVAFFVAGLVLLIPSLSHIQAYEKFHEFDASLQATPKLEKEEESEGKKGAKASERTPLLNSQAGGDAEGSYQSPVLASKSNPTTPNTAGRFDKKKLRVGERRNSLRPSLVCQIQGEFASKDNLQEFFSNSLSTSHSGSRTKHGFGGRQTSREQEGDDLDLSLQL